MADSTHPENPTCFGYCPRCDEVHSLGIGNSRQYALELMAQMDQEKSIDLSGDNGKKALKLGTDYLWGEARGQMFGVLECEDYQGNTVILKAFSCQYNGEWIVDGWVPPVLDVGVYNQIVPPVDAEIKKIGKELGDLTEKGPKYTELRQQRKKLSQQLMKEIHDLYTLHNFCGEKFSLKEAFYSQKGQGIPTGSGDCCAPKLLNQAAKMGLKPLGLSEFFYGRENRSGTRQHGEFYPCCEGKCQPILGTLLCGLN